MSRKTLARRKSSTSHASGRRRSSAHRPTRAKEVPGARDFQSFFDRFTYCLTAGDGEGAAACFEHPAFLVMSSVGEAGGQQTMPDAAATAAMFAKSPEQYNAKGIYETFAVIEDVEYLPGDLCIVRCRFPYIDADGNDMGNSESSLYIVRRRGDDWKICCAVTLGVESER